MQTPVGMACRIWQQREQTQTLHSKYYRCAIAFKQDLRMFTVNQIPTSRTNCDNTIYLWCLYCTVNICPQIGNEYLNKCQLTASNFAHSCTWVGCQLLLLYNSSLLKFHPCFYFHSAVHGFDIFILLFIVSSMAMIQRQKGKHKLMNKNPPE